MGVSSFVHNGYQRAYSALEPKIRAEVYQEYVERLARATVWRWWWLNQEMEREIERRIHPQAPPEGLY
jgi:hypothetical protein